ncbi:hypothetical protein B0H34DRAFT_406112 [Crassisporium funariophilum]|nr:hypothetical protein B0H34DRAFT_406112 [Crassisporium funariophilum]
MTAPEEFEVILKEVVNAKRLSASKMIALTDLAMKNLEHDTQIVSILYRTHKSLPAACKVSSLYVFDALCRAAKHHVIKHGVSGDSYTQPGNSATFLLKVGGVVEGLFQDMVVSGNSESKEKTKKILDIWVKGNTFPSAILSQLSDVLKQTDKVPESKSTLTTDPRINMQPNHSPPTSIPPSSIPTMDPQATLLALLTQAAASSANVPTSQTTPNIGPVASQLGAVQLAMLQQLAHTAASVPSISQSLTPPEPVNVKKFPSSSGVSGSSHSPSSHRDELHNAAQKEQRSSRYRSPENEFGANPSFNERDNMRGKYRGGLHGRGRDDRSGHKWDDRDRDRHKGSEVEWAGSPTRAGRGGRSRSRSPPSRYEGRRNSRLYSPPRRQRVASPHLGHQGTSKTDADPAALGKDEFGRDIRPQSPRSPSVVIDKSPPPRSPTTPAVTKPLIVSRSSLAVATNHDPKSVSPLVTANTSSNKTSAALVTNTVSSRLGMESFDLATFDYTSPASWEALGKLWQVTHGYLPSTEQLMQFVVSCGTGQMNSQNIELSNGDTFQSHPQSNQTRGRGRGRGGFQRGRGGMTYGNGRNIQEGSDYDMSQATDAIVLGGEEVPHSDHQIDTSFQGQDNAPQESQGMPVSSSGRMQRVGDKWVFVRGSAMDVS